MIMLDFSADGDGSGDDVHDDGCVKYSSMKVL